MKSGIYKIRNIINDKVYIGSAFNIKQRWNRHLNELKQNKHHSPKLQRSFNKYGFDNFIFEIIELCEKELLIEREQYWVDFLSSYNNGYNSTPNVIKPMLGRKHTEITKKLMSEKHLGKKVSSKTKEKLSLINKGKKYDIYTKERNLKISNALKGEKNYMFGKHMSEGVKKKLIEKNNKKIRQFTKDGIFIRKWDSISECAKYLGVDNSSITKVCKGKLITTKNFKFSYE